MDPGESQSSSEDDEKLDCETPSLTQQFSSHVDQRSPLEDDPPLWPKQLSDNERCSIVQNLQAEPTCCCPH